MFKIGFCDEEKAETAPSAVPAEAPRLGEPRRSVVRVAFPDSPVLLDYYNDLFDLHRGDLVFVSGKKQGTRGRVIEVSYNFKIRLSAYERVVALVDSEVHGEFFSAGSHFVSFDPAALPREKAIGWFRCPDGEDDDFVSGSDDSSFPLADLSEMEISPKIAERGHDYYTEDRVEYLSLNGEQGYAIVMGSQPYEVEFEYSDGMIRRLLCTCPCSYNCKHEFAVMLQLRETLELIGQHYAERYDASGCFAAVLKRTLFSVAIDGKESGFTL